MSLRRASLVLFLLVAACGDAGRTASPPPTSEVAQPIIGGVEDKGHPYVVGVGDEFSGAFCSGTLISRRTVITAGHCFEATPAMVAYFGVDAFSPTAVAVKADKQVRHPGFDDVTLANDLTLIHLEKDPPVQPAPLLRETMTNDPQWIGPSFTFVGYGDDDSTGGGFGLRRVALFPIFAVGPAGVGGTPGAIDATQIYYRVPGKNTCNGDSGGPAFVVRNGVERHAATTSFGDGPCKIDGIDARTDGPAIDKWIQATIDAFEADDACRADGTCNDDCQTGHADLVDPDCAEKHCGKDGVCALSCALPADPDCAAEVPSRCVVDGICDPTCSPTDPDCTGLCGKADGVCVAGCATPDPDCCGNGAIDQGEECDDGATNGLTKACLPSCRKNVCGDGFVLEGVEACDDGASNGAPGEGCDASCHATATCGNGVVDSGEECDDGAQNGAPGDGCDASCRVATPSAGGAGGEGGAAGASGSGASPRSGAPVVSSTQPLPTGGCSIGGDGDRPLAIFALATACAALARRRGNFRRRRASHSSWSQVG